MKKKLRMNILFLNINVILLLFCSRIYAQQMHLNKVWDINNGNLGEYDLISTAIAPNGNIIQLSNNQPTGNSHIFSNCIGSNGNVLWQQNFPNISQFDDYGVDVKVDNLGNIYACAAKHNGINYDFYITKNSDIGTLIWQYQFNGTGNGDDFPSMIELDANYNVLVTGSSTGQSTMQDFTTLKLNGTDGSQIWINQNQIQKPQIATCMTLTANGDVIVSGSSFTNEIKSNIFTVKYSGINGSVINSNSLISTGNGLDFPTGMKINEFGEIMIVGTIKSNLANSNIKLIAYTGNLQLIWDKTMDKNGKTDEGHSINIDSNGNPIITGFCMKINSGTNLFVAKLNRLNGDIVWERERTTLNDFGECKGHDVVCDNDNIYICGEEDKNGIKNFLTLCISQDGMPLWSRLHNDNSTDSKAMKIKLHNEAILVSGKSTVGGEKVISTVKYSLMQKPDSVEYVNGKMSHIEGAVLVRFSDEQLNLSTINNKSIESGILQDFISPSLLFDMEIKTGFNWSKFNTFKIHRRATTADSLSITRLGDTIKLPKFWASLLIDIPFDIDEQKVCDSLVTLDYGIYHSTPNFVGGLYGHPNDPIYFPSQFGLYPNDNFPNSDVNVRDAWDIESGKDYVRVGVFDEIVDWSHPDFGDGTISGSKVVDGVDYTAGDFQYANFTSLSHGTAVAGIIGALRNNSNGIAGIAGGDASQGNTGCELLTFGIFKPSGLITNQQGITDYATIAEAVIEGSTQTTNNYGFGLHVQNHSWGIDILGTADFQEAFEIAFKNHCVLVAARGNSGETNDAVWPACDNDKMVITVIASGTDGNRKNGTLNGEGTWQSSYGRDGSNNTILCEVDVMAPGVNQLVGTTYSTYGNPYIYNNCDINTSLFTCFDGTSAAAPHVAGVAALMCSQHNTINGFVNNLATEDVEKILEKTATDMNSTGYDLFSGFGRMNATSAVQHVSSPYSVKHMLYGPNQASLTNDQTTNNVSIYGGSSLGIPNGTNFYEAKRYEVAWNINETLNQGEQIIDWWELTASQRVGKFSNVNASNNPYTNSNLNVSIGGNTVSGTVKTYTYSLKQTASSNILWYPINPNDLQYAYSLHLIEAPAGLLDDNTNKFSLYPNPTNNSITVKFNIGNNENNIINIFDATGRLVISTKTKGITTSENKISIDLSKIENGLYYCYISSENESFTKSFVLSR
jgi:hypothetical protein